MLWAFAENPAETFNIICHVLRQCTYDLILGSGFLTATETMSKHRRRITECIFSVFNVFHFSFLDNNYQFLEGTLGDTQTVHASPDTGAERNVMDMQYVGLALLYHFQTLSSFSYCYVILCSRLRYLRSQPHS